ncbi:MAG: MATE family efflux transporter [Oscillospiraceae bacterium]|nr:MATE family efflux transporter [Oscillospiraceae bacterium]
MANKLEKQIQREEVLRNGPIAPGIIKMAMPCIVAFLISSIYSLADTYFVSSIGTQATAAVGINSSLELCINLVGSLFATGAGSLVSRLLGARQKDRAETVLSSCFNIVGIFGIFILVFGSLFIHPVVRLLGATPTIEQYAVQYATYVLLAAPFMSTSFVMNQCLRAEGSATLSMIGMGFGGVLNCFLDPLFIVGLNLGVSGASIATAISKFVSFAILLFPYITRRSILRLHMNRIRMEWKTFKEVMFMGSTAALRTVLTIIAGVIMNTVAGRISDSVLASISVCNKVMMFPFSIALGFGQGYTPVSGYNWGAKQYDRVLESYHTANRIGVTGACVLALLFGVFAKQLMMLFTDADVEMLKVGIYCIRVQCLMLPLHVYSLIVNMLCISTGKAKGALLLSTSRQGTFFIPFVHLSAYLFGAYGIASVQAFADLLSLSMVIPLRRSMLKMVKETKEKYEANPQGIEAYEA